MFKVITIQFNRNIRGFDEGILNNFLTGKHVKSYKAEFFSDGEEKYWTVFVEYDSVFEKKEIQKPDDGLDETQKVLFERLRQWRKERAEKEGIPVYIIGTNNEFVNIVKTAPKSLEALSNIKGFGKSKVEKYGKEIIEIIKAFYEKS